jgi:AP-3 complex subunit beta
LSFFQIKKLVYVYLTRYAEERQDVALLSISTFQRALKDPNQLIRASALRVLSSIRVPVIVPIMMLAIRDSAVDMSPFVRKTAAHAIPKLYSLDAEQKEELVGVIEKLLADRTTLVVGSAVMAFEEVCPERKELRKTYFFTRISLFFHAFYFFHQFSKNKDYFFDKKKVQLFFTLEFHAAVRGE